MKAEIVETTSLDEGCKHLRYHKLKRVSKIDILLLRRGKRKNFGSNLDMAPEIFLNYNFNYDPRLK